MKKLTTHLLIILVGLLSHAYAENQSNLLLTMPPILAANMVDCNGAPGGTAVVDSCGICDGDGSSCVGNVPTVTSAGQVWMDRNLGASRVATSLNDQEAWGDLYQWGRGSDGHQKRSSPTTTTLSINNSPGHGRFIIGTNDTHDWRGTPNDDLWQGITGMNNPCPSGFRIPTYPELNQEQLTWTKSNSGHSTVRDAVDSIVHWPPASTRRPDGFLFTGGNGAMYWSSTTDVGRSVAMKTSWTKTLFTLDGRSNGGSVRCIKD